MLKPWALVSALLLVAGSGEASSTCFLGKFHCDNGDEISMWGKCNGGQSDCRDLSDEKPAMCAVPNTTLAVGDSLTATVRYDSNHNSIVFLLCGDQGCNGLWLDGPLSSGGMKYEADSGCNLLGFQCSLVSHTFADGTFLTGDLVFGVERNATGLSVWREGLQEHTAFLPAPLEYTNLKVRPGCWDTNMDVQFGDAVSSWPPVPAPSQCPPAVEYLLLPVAARCGEYIVCIRGIPQRKRCPSPTQFNYSRQTCDLSANMPCKG